MMTIDDITKVLKMLTANYGEDFYRGTNEEDVLTLWAVQFANDDPGEVMKAVQNCIATLPYKPRIADIRKRIAGSVMKGQMTTMEAFQEISKAVRKSYDRESAAAAFNDLPPILRKVVGQSAQLASWRKVNDEAFQTVIMSAIRESYREKAQQEADYYAMPKPLQSLESWRIEGAEQEALPEPIPEKTVDEIIEESNRHAAEHGMKMTEDLLEKNKIKVEAFLAPITPEEVQQILQNLALSKTVEKQDPETRGGEA